MAIKNFTNLQKKISDICNKKQFLSQNTPVSISAACIYVASTILKLPITRANVSSITKTSEVTISKCYKELQPHMELFKALSKN